MPIPHFPITKRFIQMSTQLIRLHLKFVFIKNSRNCQIQTFVELFQCFLIIALLKKIYCYVFLFIKKIFSFLQINRKCVMSFIEKVQLNSIFYHNIIFFNHCTNVLQGTISIRSSNMGIPCCKC